MGRRAALNRSHNIERVDVHRASLANGPAAAQLHNYLQIGDWLLALQPMQPFGRCKDNVYSSRHCHRRYKNHWAVDCYLVLYFIENLQSSIHLKVQSGGPEKKCSVLMLKPIVDLDGHAMCSHIYTHHGSLCCWCCCWCC